MRGGRASDQIIRRLVYEYKLDHHDPGDIRLRQVLELLGNEQYRASAARQGCGPGCLTEVERYITYNYGDYSAAPTTDNYHFRTDGF
jgi:hypothetical protein